MRISQMAKVTIRYWAAAREAAGMAEESVEASTLAGVLRAAVASRAPESRLGEVLARSSFLIDAAPARRAAAETIELIDGAVIEVLPPFAGG
jgi:molybdopterin converting factor small subunit